MSGQFLGIDGKFILLDGSFVLPNTQSKTVSPTNDMQVITPDEGYIGLDTVNIEGLYAIISVSYPEGSTCTCTSSDESIIFTAKDTNGNALFNIPCNGTWTVICYDGADYDSSENKKSEIVEITSEGQSVNLYINYILLLYDSGNQCDEITGGWANRGKIMNDSFYKNNSFSFNSDNMKLSQSETGSSGTVSTINKIPLSGYSVVKADVQFSSELNNECDLWLTNATQYLYQNNISKASASAPYIGTLSLPLDGTVNMAYIALGAMSNFSGSINFTITKVWLE